jgi:hypothetical protein
MKENRIGKMRDGLTPQYKHSAIFFGDNITGDESRHCWGKAPQTNH